MDKFGPTVAIGIVFVGILVLMVLSWRRRTRRDSGIAPRTLAETGPELATADALYVASTVHERPMERLAPAGLGFRGRARVSVFAGAGTAGMSTDGAVSIAVDGSDEVVIPAADIVDVAPATWTIDRVVERDGLLLIAWRDRDDAILDSYVRIVNADERERLMGAIRQVSTHDANSEE